jgi:adenylate cyclase
MAEALRTFRLALGRYRAGAWRDAKQGFADVLELNPSDKPAQLYIERCEFFEVNPPAKGWNGVWVMHDK